MVYIIEDLVSAQHQHATIEMDGTLTKTEYTGPRTHALRFCYHLETIPELFQFSPEKYARGELSTFNIPVFRERHTPGAFLQASCDIIYGIEVRGTGTPVISNKYTGITLDLKQTRPGLYEIVPFGLNLVAATFSRYGYEIHGVNGDVDILCIHLMEPHRSSLADGDPTYEPEAPKGSHDVEYLREVGFSWFAANEIVAAWRPGYFWGGPTVAAEAMKYFETHFKPANYQMLFSPEIQKKWPHLDFTKQIRAHFEGKLK